MYICILQTYSLYLCGVSRTPRMPLLIIPSGDLGVLQTLRFHSECDSQGCDIRGKKS